MVPTLRLYSVDGVGHKDLPCPKRRPTKLEVFWLRRPTVVLVGQTLWLSRTRLLKGRLRRCLELTDEISNKLNKKKVVYFRNHQVHHCQPLPVNDWKIYIPITFYRGYIPNHYLAVSGSGWVLISSLSENSTSGFCAASENLAAASFGTKRFRLIFSQHLARMSGAGSRFRAMRSISRGLKRLLGSGCSVSSRSFTGSVNNLSAIRRYRRT